MNTNLKAPAREVQKVCRNTRVTKALKNLARTNTSADRDHQWSKVERQFTTNCDMAQRIVVTPNPQPSMLATMDPEYTKSIADRVVANASNSTNPTGGKRRRHNKTNRKNRARKTRRSTRR